MLLEDWHAEKAKSGSHSTVVGLRVRLRFELILNVEFVDCY